VSIAEQAHELGALTIVEAARRLDIEGVELIRAMREHRIRYVMVQGIAHIPEDAIEEYRTPRSQ
jgi:DNA transposition AAA+ family ATPase